MLQLGKDFEEAVKNKATTVLLYFANTLIEKKKPQKIEKPNRNFFFFKQTLMLKLISFKIMKSNSQDLCFP